MVTVLPSVLFKYSGTTGLNQLFSAQENRWAWSNWFWNCLPNNFAAKKIGYFAQFQKQTNKNKYTVGCCQAFPDVTYLHSTKKTDGVMKINSGWFKQLLICWSFLMFYSRGVKRLHTDIHFYEGIFLRNVWGISLGRNPSEKGSSSVCSHPLPCCLCLPETRVIPVWGRQGKQCLLHSS